MYTASHQTQNVEDRGGCINGGGGPGDGDNVSDTDFVEMDQNARGGLSEQMDEGNEPDDGDEWHGFAGDEEHAELTDELMDELMDERSGDAQMNVEGNECDKDLEKSVEERGIEDPVRRAYFIALQLLTILDVGDGRNGGLD
jgi:hypothetical protein